jgi:predicted lipoprotein
MLVIAAFVAFLALSCTVIETKAPQKTTELSFYFDNDKFDAKQYVENIWEERVLPYMESRAVELPVLIGGLKQDPDATCVKYGYRAVEEENPYNFSAKGRIRVLGIIQGSNSRLEGDIEPFDGVADVLVQVGPVFRGTSIRDMLDFVKFDDFTNQVDFAKLSNELNFKVRDDVVRPFVFKENDYAGHLFGFLGATTWVKKDPLLVLTPLKLVEIFPD